MTRAFNIIICFLLFATVSFAQKKDEELIRKAFAGYQAAIQSNNGYEAVKYLDSRTTKYYEDLLMHVKTSDSTVLNAMPLLDKMMVLTVRHSSTKLELLSFDTKGFLIYTINKGMAGNSSGDLNIIDSIIIQDDLAKAKIISNGKKLPALFYFYREGGKWKYNLTSLITDAKPEFKRIVEESGQAENDYLLHLLETMTGKKPGNEIWLPVK